MNKLRFSIRSVFVGIILIVTSFSISKIAIAAGPVPEFSFTGADGTVHSYTTTTVDDAYVKAIITEVSSNQWQLNITPKQTIRDLYFPWQAQRFSLNGNMADDIYYYPYIMGVTFKASYVNSAFSFVPFNYPGSAGLPLTVIADKTDGRIVAAINWPPKTVAPLFGGEKQVLKYPVTLSAGSTSTYNALIAKVSGNALTGSVPWQLALDQYKSWLNANMGSVNYPAWMWEGEGIFNIQLQNSPSSSATMYNNMWQPYKSTYPWILMWGQMSGYAVACCGLSYDMYGPYINNIPDWVKNTIAANGYHAGYYSAPYYNDKTGYSLDTTQGVNWLTGWFARNKNSYNANSYYIDVLARGYWGDAVKMKQLFDNNTIPQEAMLEGAIDMYPRPALISGSLLGDANGCGAPFKRPENFNSLSFPNFVRYVLGDRLVYQGSSNTDWIYWGNNRGWGSYDWCPGITAYCSANGPCENGSERLAFLIGAKLDAMTLTGNPIQDQIVSERQRVKWWERRPIYLDTKDLDLTTIPASSKVEITHFKDKNGIDLLAVSNPKGIAGLSFKLSGQTFSVPTKAISVLETGNISPTPTFTPSPTPIPLPAGSLRGDLNRDGIVNSLDWSVMNSKWFTVDASADLNSDGIVNSLDFSIMNGNWLKTI